MLIGVPSGSITGFGVWLIGSCVLFSGTLLLLSIVRPLDRMAPIAFAATAYFGFYLLASVVHSILSPRDSGTLLAILFWLVPLQIFNKVVNRGEKARIMGWVLLVAPLIALGLLWSTIMQVISPSLTPLLVVFCLSHVASALMLNILLRYRESFYSELEQTTRLRYAGELLESVSDGFIALDREWRFTYINLAAEHHMKRSRAELIGKVIWDEYSPLSNAEIRVEFERVVHDDRNVAFEHQSVVTSGLLRINAYPSTDGIAVFFQDLTDQHATQQALRMSEGKLAEQAELIEKANDAIMVRDIGGRILYWNASATRLFGLAPEEVLGRQVHEVLRFDPALSMEATAKVLEDGEWRRVMKVPGVDGRELTIDSHLTLIRDEAGQPKSILTINTDITANVAIEERLHRSERLEALGQLTGGVAHDFNNLLTVVSLNAEVIIATHSDRDDLRALADMIKQAAKRGGALTQRLLAFARQQHLDPVSTDVHGLLANSQPLLRQALREDISLAVHEDTEIWDVLVDPHQLENALLNLCVNAKDAMPDGGALTIEAVNVTLDRNYTHNHTDIAPGDYVAITVTDSGTGIEPENLGQVFNPFFTTKEFGAGTGLGLSMVYGFIKQSRGHVSIYSEPGHGTTVKLFLPRELAAPEASGDDGVALEGIGGTETVLVVEDDDLLCASVERQLIGLGYNVITCANGLAALEVIRAGTAIDLLFTDVIMPGGMNGPALAKAARELVPELRVLYTSGYTEKVIARSSELEGDIHMLSKPYAMVDLALKVRALLVER